MEVEAQMRLFVSCIIAIFLIFCLHVFVFSQAVDRDLASLRAMVRHQLATEGRATGLLTNTTVDYAINRAIAQVCTKYPALAKLDTVFVTQDSMGVGLNTDFDRIIGVKRFAAEENPDQPDQVVVALTYKHPDSLPKDMGTEQAGKEKDDYLHSIKYFYTVGNRLMLWPKTSSLVADSFLVEYYAQDEMLVDSTDSTLIYYRYIEKVINHACMSLSGTRKDYGDAYFYWNLYEDKIPEVPEKR